MPMLGAWMSRQKNCDNPQPWGNGSQFYLGLMFSLPYPDLCHPFGKTRSSTRNPCHSLHAVLEAVMSMLFHLAEGG